MYLKTWQGATTDMPMFSEKNRKGQPIQIRIHQGHCQDDRVELEKFSRVSLTWRSGRAADF